MGEMQWLTSDDPRAMLDALLGRRAMPGCVRLGKASERKLRLFACACCRAVWHLLTDERSRRAVEVAEQFADGHATQKDLTAARAAARDVAWDAAWAATRDAARDAAWAATSGVQAQILRDVIGNPFKPHLSPASHAELPRWLAWNGRTVHNIAAGIYESRNWHDLPILADALEEAGCDSAELLNHCRSGEPHVRGCWAVDLILGKK